MKIRTKILLPVIILSGVIFIVFLSSVAGLQAIRQTTEALSRTNARILMASELRATSRALQRDALNLIMEDGGNRAAILDRFNQRLRQMATENDMLGAALTAAGDTEAQQIPPLEKDVITALTTVRDLVGAGSVDQALTVFRRDVRTAERAASARTDPLIEQGRERIQQESAAVRQVQNVTLWTMIATTLAGVALGVGLSLIITRRALIQPISAIIRAMGHLAERHYDFALDGTLRTDEMGEMARAAIICRDALREGDAQAAQRERERRARETEQARRLTAVEAFVTRMNALSSNLHEEAGTLNDNARSLSDTADRTSTDTRQAAVAAQRTSSNIQTVAAATEELSFSIREISARTAETAGLSNGGAEEARRTAARVVELRETAARIGDVIALINGIASQTNLLALNASIEAARAGEAGKGFAVVAGEVKALVTQTAKATEEINGQVTAVQDATGSAVASIERIVGIIASIDGMITSIAAAVEEQASATAEITRNVQEAADGTQQITRDIDRLAETARGTGTAASAVRDVSVGISRRSDDLKDQVGSFAGALKQSAA